MSSLLFLKNNSIPKIVVNLLNITRTFSQIPVACQSSLLSSALFKKPRLCYTGTQLWQSHLIKRHIQTQYWEINTNVLNNVILYKLENLRFFKIAHVCGICGIIWWTVQLWYLHKDSFFSDIWIKPIKQYIEENCLSLALLFFSTVLGPLFYLFLCFFCMRSIKYVILNRGGNHVSFVTLHPLKSKRIITVPTEKVYCVRPRTDRQGAYTSVKIDNHRFHFLIDKRGTYVNPELFDHTVAWHK